MSITTETGSSPIFLGSGDGMGFGNGCWIWAFLIMMMFGGFGGFGGSSRPATQDFVQNQANYSNLLDQNRDLSNLITSGTAQSVAAVNQTFHDTLNAVSDKYSELARDIAAVQVGQANVLANQNECCGSTKMMIAEGNAATNANIAQSRYDAALNTAAINANTTAQTQKILDAISGNRMADMQNEIDQLKLQNAMNGVIRYPNSWTFNAGPFPCGCNYGFNPFVG
jgi:hypothetical protein